MPEQTLIEWLRYERKAFTKMKAKWDYVRYLASGEYIDEEHIETYLIRREQGETKGMYRDRKKTLDPDLLFSNLLGKITGQFFKWGEGLSYTWENEESEGGLGSPDDPESRAYQLINNTDGTGCSLAVWERTLFRALLQYEAVDVYVRGPTTEHGGIHWLIITPDKVPDWQEEGQRTVMLKIRHESDRRETLRSEPKTIVQYSIFTLVGMERWEIVEDERGKDEPVQTVSLDDGAYTFFVEAGSSEQRLPVVRSHWPLKMNLSYLLAKKAASILNHESQRDNILRIANLPRLVHKGAEPIFEKLVDLLKKGQNFLGIGKEEEIEYTVPPTGAATLAGEVVTDKRANFFTSAYQIYEDEARQAATATEIKQRGSGRVILLDTLAGPFDDIIRQCLFLTEQIQYPEQDRLWGVAKAERKGEFKPDETEQEAERDAKAFFGSGVPLSRSAFHEALRRQYEARGVMPDADAFISEADIEYVLYKTDLLTEQGYAAEQAAALVKAEGAVFSDEMETALTRTDFALFGGDGL